MTSPRPTASTSTRDKSLSALALAATLAALTMLGPFSIDTYLPAFPAIAESLRTSSVAVQQSLALYMLSFATMTLWHGALSDSFGRRNVILGSLVVFAGASIGCAMAPTIEVLWMFRILQGTSAGAGAVVGRAMIRDIYDGTTAQRLFSLVTMIFAIGPALSPIIGGWIVTLIGWRSIFLFLFLYAALLTVYCWRSLPETLARTARPPFRLKSLWRRYTHVFSTTAFILYAGTLSLYAGGFFLYIAAAPVFVLQHLRLGPHQFGWQLIPTVAGIFAGSVVANRLAGRMKATLIVKLGFGVMGSAAVANLGYHCLFAPALPWSVIPLFVYGAGNSLATPALTLMVMDLFPAGRGIAASCQSFLHLMLSAAIAGIVAPLLSPSPVWLAAGQFGFVALAIATWSVARSWSRKHQS